MNKPEYALDEAEYLEKHAAHYGAHTDVAKADYANIIEESQSNIVFDGKEYWWHEPWENIWFKMLPNGGLSDDIVDDKPLGTTMSSLEFDKLINRQY